MFPFSGITIQSKVNMHVSRIRQKLYTTKWMQLVLPCKGGFVDINMTIVIRKN